MKENISDRTDRPSKKSKALNSKPPIKGCASGACSNSEKSLHANEKYYPRIRRIGGQINGIERMITENRYCPEILLQIRAAKSALHSLEMQMLETHLRGCVANAFLHPENKDSEAKIRELLDILR